MQRTQPDFEAKFKVAAINRRAQAASMTLAPGESTGGPDNRHRGADQWLFVVEGDGEARIDGKVQALAAGTLLLIEQGESHEIRNTGQRPLRTLNLYVPPAYGENGDELPAGRD